MDSADETMGVATSGQGKTAQGARILAETSLDAFDGRSAQMLDTPGLLELLGGVPSGFVAGVRSDCERMSLLRGVNGLSGCLGVVISADVLSGNRTVFHSLIGFTDPDLAKTAMGKAAEVLENQSPSHGFENPGMRQEDHNLRVRVISELPKFPYVFELFSSGR
ncbi:MAG: hypothetical protein VX264_03400 [Chloroflexota bacterium]|nr:hypothetical protein [Chloroflexota bacterium]